MGLLDQVVGAALGGAKGGGLNAGLMQQLLGMLTKPGALDNLMGAFQQQGLGNVLQSWLGTGQNLPISPSQVQQVFGADAMTELAKGAGIGVPETASALSALLPKVVDKITPDGKVPSTSDLGGLLASVGKFLG
ncbi:YidB family protein [Povalibacter sp.]|uniref:YidB family protein n=1 Tax=Povalibacter sp. TaxID=1962978 RepID=UPI002F424DCE